MQLKRSRKVPVKIDILDSGDTALLVDFRAYPEPLSQIHQLSELLSSLSPAWLLDLIPGIDSLLIVLKFSSYNYQDTRSVAKIEIEALLKQLLSETRRETKSEVVHRIRVCYDPELAPDLLASAEKCKLTVRELINRHKNSEIKVDILGFMPGFSYCSGLDPSLNLPRLESPRTAVPEGSVAIAGLQTAIYPQPTPGGWNIIGRSPDVLFDPSKPRPSLLMAGERVEFIEIDLPEFRKIEAQNLTKRAQNMPKSKISSHAVEVISPGLQTTIQGLPRHGFAHLALSAGGPMDLESAQLANALLGNHDDAAGLEIAGAGTKLLFHEDIWVAWVGARCISQVNGVAIPGNRPVFLRKGETLSFGTILQGYRIFLALSGGIDSEFILGGRGSHLSAGIGGKALQKGDILYLPRAQDSSQIPCLKKLREAQMSFPKWSIASPALPGEKVEFIKVLPSIHLNILSSAEQDALWKTVWTISSQSNRMGMRLKSDFKISSSLKGISSQGIWFGTVQLPPSGQPILMMAEHQTTGGYPRLMEMVSFERSKLAQLRPGDKIQFLPITLDEADQINAVYFIDQRKTFDNVRVTLLAKS
jgi:KipI family sensor histidine kinase inhibitor